MTLTTPSALRDLMDKVALDELIRSVSHALDARDWPAYRAHFADTAEFDFTDHASAPKETDEIIVGPDRMISVMRTVMDGLEAAQHHVTNLVHHLDGDEAQSDCYVLAEHFLNNDRGDRDVTLGARYAVVSHRFGDGWQIVRWRFTTAWFRGNPMLYELAMRATSARASGGVAAT